MVSSLGDQVLLEMHQDDGHEGFGEEEAVKMAEQYLDIRIRRIPLQKNALMVTGESMTFFGKFLR